MESPRDTQVRLAGNKQIQLQKSALLAAAASRNDVPALNDLLNHGADPNIYESWEVSPLYAAVMCDALEAAECLLNSGINFIYLVDFENLLGLAVKRRNELMIGLLIRFQPTKEKRISHPTKGVRLYGLLLETFLSGNMNIFSAMLEHCLHLERDFSNYGFSVDYEGVLINLIIAADRPDNIVAMIKLLLDKKYNHYFQCSGINFNRKLLVDSHELSLMNLALKMGATDHYQIATIFADNHARVYQPDAMGAPIDVARSIFRQRVDRDYIDVIRHKCKLMRCILKSAIGTLIGEFEESIKEEEKRVKPQVPPGEAGLISAALTKFSTLFASATNKQLLQGAILLQEFLLKPSVSNTDLLQIEAAIFGHTKLKSLLADLQDLIIVERKFQIGPETEAIIRDVHPRRLTLAASEEENF